MQIKELGIMNYILNYNTEIGYVFLNWIVGIIFNDFQWVLIISSVICITCMYKAFWYEKEKISLSLCIFVFFLTQFFFYLHGILRLSVAIGIVAFGYHYLCQGNTRKYVYTVLVASTFHYSALFMIVFIFLINFKKKNNISIVTINYTRVMILVISLPFVMLLFNKIGGAILNERYYGYMGNLEFNIKGCLDKVIICAVLLFFRKPLKKVNSNNSIYIIMYIITIFIELYSPIFNLSRIIWYMSPVLCFLLPSMVKIFKDKGMQLVIAIGITMYCMIYMIYSYFLHPTVLETLVPYKSIIYQFVN